MPFSLAELTPDQARRLAVILEVRDSARTRLVELCDETDPTEFVGMPPEAGATGVYFISGGLALHPLGLNLWLAFQPSQTEETDATMVILNDEEVSDYVSWCQEQRLASSKGLSRQSQRRARSRRGL
jgi:hypothetical protein